MAAKMDRMKQAETKLLSLAREFGDRSAYEYNITTLDTPIPRQVIPLRPLGTDEDEQDLSIHSVRIQSSNANTHLKNGERATTTQVPLVLLHGYMNAAAYFYRNLVGLSHYFDTIHSLDMLGWGLSSRPEFDLLTTKATNKENNDPRQEELAQVDAAEQFFVESLEAWRERNGIDKMILAGHSMGGYMSVAYCEKYPERVERLILLSPVGVPEESEDTRARRESMRQASWRFWVISSLAQNIFHYHNPAKVYRSIPASWGESMTANYVKNRLPAISDPIEQEAIAEYLVANNALPGSGEHCLKAVLNPFAYAKRPTEYRIPHLKVKSIAFLFGQSDWMDSQGGLTVQKKCQEMRARDEEAPDVSVYQISKAGHLLMLENWKEFNAAVILGAGGSLDCLPNTSDLSVPTVLQPKVATELTKDQPQASTGEQQRRSSTASLSETSQTSVGP